MTTIFRFEGAGELNTRDNIIVFVDEAHRTTEGTLGEDMREALPNARFFGLTGTPIADKERNTFTLFGDPNDPGNGGGNGDEDGCGVGSGPGNVLLIGLMLALAVISRRLQRAT